MYTLLWPFRSAQTTSILDLEHNSSKRDSRLGKKQQSSLEAKVFRPLNSMKFRHTSRPNLSSDSVQHRQSYETKLTEDSATVSGAFLLELHFVVLW